MERRARELEAAAQKSQSAVDALEKDRAERAATARAEADAAKRKLVEERRAEADKKVPFTDDYTWMNGQSRQKDFPLTFSDHVTMSLYLDTYYAYSFNQPKDDTLTGSASVGRHNELQINLASIGLDWSYENVIGRILLQYGSMLNIVQELDGTTGRGRTLSTDGLKYIREATLGYHFDAGYGINLEMGMFMSYIGLESYLLGENWTYNRSIVCDFTPFYFTGIRAQFFPTKNLKIEPWLMNGYQTYGKWNQAPAGGLAFRWNPEEWIALIANVYAGTDTRGDEDRARVHHDHSVLVRYYDSPTSKGVSKAAFSVNNHLGFEAGGDGPGIEDAHFIGTAISNRVWFFQNYFALVGRLDLIQHGGGYTAQFPPPGFVAGDDFRLWGVTGTFEVMPTSYFGIKTEVMYRASNKEFFAGEGGTTSPDGFRDTEDPTFVPDTEKDQLLLTIGANFRL